MSMYTVILIIKIFLIFLTTFIGTLFILPKLIHIASTWVVTKEGANDINYSLMDFPDNKRKIHREPKPLVGGVGMLIMVSLSSILFVPPEDLNLRGYYTAVIILGIVGFLDDFKEIHYRWKLIIQMLAVIIMIHYSKTTLLSFGDLLSFGSLNLGFSAVYPLTIFCTLGVINSINMIDGLDGLAGGISLIAFIAFAILSFLNKQINIMLLSIALSGAVIGFLRYNWYPSKLFMGDAGSYFMGFSLAFLSIYITQQKDSVVPPVAALLILAVPIVDTVTIMVKRIIIGKNPFSADKNHFHHILLRYGIGEKTAVKVIFVLSSLFACLSVGGTILNIPDYYIFLIFSTYFIIYFIGSFFIKEYNFRVKEE